MTPLTASILYDYTQCPRRVGLDLFGDDTKRDPVNPFIKLLWERGSLFERETINGTSQPFLDLSGLDGPAKETATLEAMKRGEPLIYNGRISTGRLLGIPDLLRRDGDGYVPGDIKAGNAEEAPSEDEDDGKPKKHYAVQLAIYVDILKRLGLSGGRRGFIWDVHGREVMYDLTLGRGPKTPNTMWVEYEIIREEAAAILDGTSKPLGAYASACKLCHWHTFCTGELRSSDDLTLIPQLGRSLRDTMVDTVASVALFAGSDVESFMTGRKKTVFKGVLEERLRKFHRRATLLTTNNAKPILTGPVRLPAVDTELFFDIEVDPMRDLCYLHGIVERAGGDNSTEKFVYFFAGAETVDAERAAFAGAMNYFRSKLSASIYYYSKYERTLYRKLQQKFPDVCSADEIEQLFDPAKAIDLYYDVVTKVTEWPTNDQSLKTLAKFLGFKWRDTHPSGAASIEWFDRWCKDRSPEVRQRILDYNEDDCRATRILLDGIRAI